MAYASKEGRARADTRSPRAAGQCDRCGFLYQFDHLRWQLDYSGAGLYNKRILVCEKCYDTPQQQLKVIVIPPDPLPVLNARPPDYVTSETNYRQTSGQNTTDFWTGIPIYQGNTRITQNNNTRVTQQTGEPPGGRNQLPGTEWAFPCGKSGLGIPPDNDSIPYTGQLPPLKNYICIWDNNVYWKVNWSNNSGQLVDWSTTIL